MLILLYIDKLDRIRARQFRSIDSCLEYCNRLLIYYRGYPYLIIANEKVIITYEYFAKSYKKPNIIDRVKQWFDKGENNAGE